MVDDLRIGFVGAGNIVRTRHIPGLKKIPGVVLKGVCNRSAHSSQRAAKEFGIEHVFSTWEELVHSPDIDVVWIGTWPYLHHPVTIAALQAGKHVFCQARMALNLQESCEMLEEGHKSRLVTMLCPPPFGLAGDYYMQKLLKDESVLGRVYSIHFQALGGEYLNSEAPLTWRQREDLSGFNTLTVGIYAEVIHRWFGYAKNVVAQAKTFIPNRPQGKGRDKVTRPDVVMALSEMENGALMRWEWSGLAQPAPSHSVTVYGSRGALRYDFGTDDIFLSESGGEWIKQTIPSDLVREWSVEQDFIDAIREGKEVHPNFHDGVKYMEFTESIFQSVEIGKKIYLSS